MASNGPSPTPRQAIVSAPTQARATAGSPTLARRVRAKRIRKTGASQAASGISVWMVTNGSRAAPIRSQSQENRLRGADRDGGDANMTQLPSENQPRRWHPPSHRSGNRPHLPPYSSGDDRHPE